MKYFVVKLITVYQQIFSPDHSFWAKHRFPHGYCRFHPSCSEYAKQSIRKHGVFWGAINGIKRVIRCNPFSDGGYDPA